MYRDINQVKTKLTTLNSQQIANLVNQCKAIILNAKGSEEMVYILEDDTANYLSAVKCRSEVRSLAYWLDQLESLSYTGHTQISQETLDWGGGMSGTTFYTQDKSKIPTLTH